MQLFRTLIVSALAIVPAASFGTAADGVKIEIMDRYAVPDGNVDALLDFIDGLESFRPESSEEFFEHRKKKKAAVQEAARRILRLVEDKSDEAGLKASAILLEQKVHSLAESPADEQQHVVRELRTLFDSKEALSQHDFKLAHRAASEIERSGNRELASQAYEALGQPFADQEDELLAKRGQKMVGCSRWVRLVGEEMDIEGKTLAGDDFDWDAYRGKVVLVDFWATWCRPCVDDLSNVRRNFDQYHDIGFEVVGISLDTDRTKLANFVDSRDLPWANLFQDGAGWDHPVAAYYGVTSIPTAVLVDQKGKVVSTNVRGSELGRQLELLLGPVAVAD